MNRPTIISTSLVMLTLIISVSHAATEEYSENIRTLEALLGDGEKLTRLYRGRSQPDVELSQILVLPGLSITAVDGRRVRAKIKWVKPVNGWFGYRAYKQLPGTYEFEVTSWRRHKTGNVLRAIGLKLEKHVAYTLQVVLEPGQQYVLSPIWNDGEMGIIAPSRVCLQGQSDDARYCAPRPHESDDVFAMDEEHGVVVVGLTRRMSEKVYMINLACDWESPDGLPLLKSWSSANKLRDVCLLSFEAADSKGYIVESVEAGVWKWRGFSDGFIGVDSLIDTLTFEVEPGKVNYIGHFWVTHEKRRRVGFEVEDRFPVFEPIIRAGFGESEIVNKATDY